MISTLPDLEKVALKSCCTCNDSAQGQPQQQPWRQHQCECGISAIRSTRYDTHSHLHCGPPIIIGQINGNISIRRIYVNENGFSKQELLMIIPGQTSSLSFISSHSLIIHTPGKLKLMSRINCIIDINFKYNLQVDGSCTYRFAVGCDNGKIHVYEINPDYFMINNMALGQQFP